MRGGGGRSPAEEWGVGYRKTLRTLRRAASSWQSVCLCSWEDALPLRLCVTESTQEQTLQAASPGFWGRHWQLEPLPLPAPLPRAQEDFPFISFQAGRAGDSPVCGVKPSKTTSYVAGGGRAAGGRVWGSQRSNSR